MYSKIHVIFWAIILSQAIITNPSSSSSLTNPDSFILACGSTAETSTDNNGRKWTFDSKFIKSNDDSSSASAASAAQSQDPSLPSTIPYMTARIFQSQTTYQFPISPKHRHWIRLHFYPSSYSTKFDTSTSFFSVAAAGFTLLHNFSAAVTADALTQAYIAREFTLPKLESTLLDLTFTPSDNNNNNSFAFINGIEIISMPEIFQPAPMIGFSDKNIDTQSYTLQTMFRLNVGGQYIAASNDSGGLTRTWYNDSPYIYGAGFGVTIQAGKNTKIQYPSKESEYIAPLKVYSTARTMGPNATVNLNYNLTWIFQIDMNFTYLVRLHFCEFQLNKVNQMVFSIFINNQTAAAEADVIAWAGGEGVPYYKDYAIYARDGVDQLWVALHPNLDFKPEFSDSILNGLEIFKLNDTNGNLAGPNPVPSAMKFEAELQNGRLSTSPSKSRNTAIIIGSVLSSLVGLGLVFGLITFLNYRKIRQSEEFSNITANAWLPLYGSYRSSRNTNSSKSSGSSSRISSLSGGLCRHFSLAEIKLGTDDFSESRVIGVGGFGKVYKGFIDGKTTPVAIKRLNPLSEQGVHEFLNEIELLSKLRHRHLVSLIGACEENDEMILVYDYMANGTLKEHLNKTKSNPPLSWRQRLGICIGAAKGIHYLHTGATMYRIIHRDVKSTNILLDEKWVAKVSDFGISKTGHHLEQTHVTTVVKGSFGYLDPEYFRRQQLTDKSDVYSFGVVLFEVLCGRPALNPTLPREQASLADWAIFNHRRDSVKDILDPSIKEEVDFECLKHFVETAVNCLSDHGIYRPSIGEVLKSLEYCLLLQNEHDGINLVDKHETLLRIEEGDEKIEKFEDRV
ncbi:hypothetical protein ABFS82_14G004000 [Erythranthe guttata]|uniref:receptor-like protein kinase ANXUR1 n=1 Tax=Erythranthe guttata TaxID=4155 RepID=UPI00064DEAD7|nr:PREDICTED: receptor-like protein kinase ANXUR1 [Erythranthe guttata]|eukprot:XP_012840367.1 PREDICTED: receptor-like protein kinase ANXUR1 [Erythranthe guttata]